MPNPNPMRTLILLLFVVSIASTSCSRNELCDSGNFGSVTIYNATDDIWTLYQNGSSLFKLGPKQSYKIDEVQAGKQHFSASSGNQNFDWGQVEIRACEEDYLVLQ